MFSVINDNFASKLCMMFLKSLGVKLSFQKPVVKFEVISAFS